MNEAKVASRTNRPLMMQVMALAALVFSVVFSGPSVAQLVGTVGMGDIEKKTNVSEEVQRAFVDQVSLGLIKSRKFRLMEHPVVESRLARQGLDLAGFYANDYKSTELLQAGLDYIFKAEIVKAGVSPTCKGSAYDKMGEAEVRYTMFGVADVTEDFSRVVKAQSHKHEGYLDKASDEELINDAIANAVNVMVRQVASELFPVRVVSIDEDGLVTLNYGGGLLEKGQTLVVYSDDEESQMNEFGVPQGSTIGLLRVSDTSKKFAQALTVDGFDGIEKGQRVMVLNASETAASIAANNSKSGDCTPVAITGG